jgi:hypothetical protein
LEDREINDGEKLDGITEEMAGRCPEKGSVLALLAKSGLAMLYQTLPTSFESVDEGFPRPAQAKTILPVHVVRL